MRKIYALYSINFLAAFLLFQIELIIAKIFLPTFGGSYMVWGACVVFFQCALLLGYIYSHLVVQRIGMARYWRFHLILILLPLLFFPGRALPAIYSHQAVPLVMDIFFQLSSSIGLVFFALSTISIISQSWLASSSLPQRQNPFMLYAVSNFGSFLGLLSYPFLFEAYFDLSKQLTLWRLGYLLFLLFYVLCFALIKVSDTEILPAVKIFGKSLFLRSFSWDDSMKEKVFWILLSAAGCIIFLAVTNVVTYEILPCPLLWVIPLCIYLVSFTLTFKQNPFCPRWIREKPHLAIGFSILLYFITKMRILPILLETFAYFVSLFALCMFCQDRLYQSRPNEKNKLTGFYLSVALGGFLGSIFVTWVAPVLFSSPLEYLVGLFVITFSLKIKEKNSKVGMYLLRMISYLVLVMILWPLVFKKYNIFGLVLIFYVFKMIFEELKKKPQALSLGVLTVLCTAPFMWGVWAEGKDLYVHRNYYGLYRITQGGPMLLLFNGTTVHGAQYLDPKKKDEPLTYYHRNTLVGKILSSKLFSARRIGVVGLGAGTLAAYGQEDDVIDFFELDPDVFTVANIFSYLKDSRATLRYFFKDARLSLEKSDVNNYDILIIDAFSGDSIPVHLLTIEAIQEYKKHLKEKGILIFHISSRYLNLSPVLFSNADAVKAYAVEEKDPGGERGHSASVWVALTWNEGSKDAIISQLGRKEDKGKELKPRASRPWTDKYSHILSILRLDYLLGSIKQFTLFYW